MSYVQDPQTPQSSSSGSNVVVILLSIFGGLALVGLLICGGLAFTFYSAGRTMVAAMEEVSAENNLRSVGLALHNYHDAFKRVPAPSAVNSNNEPVWSWRVSLLPFLESNEEFNPADVFGKHMQQGGNLMRPWDDESNPLLQGPAPPVFRTGLSKAPTNECHVFLITARTDDKPAPMFVDGKYTRFAEVADGLSNTIMAIQFREYSRPWAAPNTMTADEAYTQIQVETKPCYVLMGDGSVFPLDKNVSRSDFDALVSRNGGEIIRLPEADPTEVYK